MNCPLCSKSNRKPLKGQIYKCAKCESIYGTCYLGDSYAYVKPFLSSENVPAEETRYFDFECLGSQGITRRHGWFNPKNGNLIQTG